MNGSKIECDSECVCMSDGYGHVLRRWNCGGCNALLVSHGMKEYAMRYDEVARFFAERGFVVYAYDHRGHGDDAKRRGELGFLAETDGFCRVVEDLREMAHYVRKCNPDGKLVLLAHSFGSFVAQRYMEEYGGEVDVCLLSGTAGPQPFLVGAGKCLSWLLKSVCGKRFRMSLMERIVFHGYNRRIKNAGSTNSWLCSDDGVVERYDSDKLCSFVPTLGFFFDLFCGLSMIHKRSEILKIPKGLPILLFSGKEDPVGGYGLTLKKLQGKYKEAGVQNVELKLYDGGRHEILNEKNRAEVLNDVLKFAEKHLQANR